MPKDPEVSRGGSQMLRHEVAHAGELAPTDEAAATAVAELIARHLGPAANVFHELVSETIHVDVHVVSPAEDDDAWTLYTTGMSDLPMSVPEGSDAPRFIELMLRLPASWQLSQEAFADERWYWPVRWLKMLARLPHEYRTFLGDGHTIPNGDPPVPIADTRFVGFVVGAPASLPDDDDVARTPDGKEIHLHAIYPLFADEMDFKLQRGWGELAERLGAADVTDVVDPARASVAGGAKGPARKRRR